MENFKEHGRDFMIIFEIIKINISIKNFMINGKIKTYTSQKSNYFVKCVIIVGIYNYKGA